MPWALLNGSRWFLFRSVQKLQINFRKVDCMLRLMMMCDRNGRFVPVSHKRGKVYTYWAEEVLADGGKKIYHLTKEYLLENSHRFDNVRISATGRVSATPSQVDWNSFETHYKYAFCERYKDMPNRNQIKIYQEYSDNLKLGDILIKKYPQLTRELIMYRGDIFSSDREVASMAYSIRNMIF